MSGSSSPLLPSSSTLSTSLPRTTVGEVSTTRQQRRLSCPHPCLLSTTLSHSSPVSSTCLASAQAPLTLPTFSASITRLSSGSSPSTSMLRSITSTVVSSPTSSTTRSTSSTSSAPSPLVRLAASLPRTTTRSLRMFRDISDTGPSKQQTK